MFAIHFEQREQAQQAGEVLASESFRVELQDQADDSVVLVASPASGAVPLHVVAARLQSLAHQFGGESFGHGGLMSFGLGENS
jgi:hypothetical protein